MVKYWTCLPFANIACIIGMDDFKTNSMLLLLLMCALQISKSFSRAKVNFHELEFYYSFRFLSSICLSISLQCLNNSTSENNWFVCCSRWAISTSVNFNLDITNTHNFGDLMYIICKRAAPFTYFRFAHFHQSIFHILWQCVRAALEEKQEKSSRESVGLEREEKIHRRSRITISTEACRPFAVLILLQ